MPKMPSEAEVMAAYESKMTAMIRDGVHEASELEKAQRQIIEELVSRALQDLAQRMRILTEAFVKVGDLMRARSREMESQDGK